MTTIERYGYIQGYLQKQAADVISGFANASKTFGKAKAAAGAPTKLLQNAGSNPIAALESAKTIYETGKAVTGSSAPANLGLVGVGLDAAKQFYTDPQTGEFSTDTTKNVQGNAENKIQANNANPLGGGYQGMTSPVGIHQANVKAAVDTGQQLYEAGTNKAEGSKVTPYKMGQAEQRNKFLQENKGQAGSTGGTRMQKLRENAQYKTDKLQWDKAHGNKQPQWKSTQPKDTTASAAIPAAGVKKHSSLSYHIRKQSEEESQEQIEARLAANRRRSDRYWQGNDALNQYYTKLNQGAGDTELTPEGRKIMAEYWKDQKLPDKFPVRDAYAGLSAAAIMDGEKVKAHFDRLLETDPAMREWWDNEQRHQKHYAQWNAAYSDDSLNDTTNLPIPGLEGFDYYKPPEPTATEGAIHDVNLKGGRARIVESASPKGPGKMSMPFAAGVQGNVEGPKDWRRSHAEAAGQPYLTRALAGKKPKGSPERKLYSDAAKARMHATLKSTREVTKPAVVPVPPVTDAIKTDAGGKS